MTLLELRTAGDPALVCQFLRPESEDRWSHRWLVDDGQQEVLLMESTEGDASLDWPPSPAFQDMSHEDLGHTEAIMGVGMAGKSHWSVSVSRENDGLVADFACLVKLEPGFLGTTYQIHADAKLEAGQLIFDLSSQSTQSIKLSARGEAQMSLADGKLRIEPPALDESIGKRGSSLRWCFAVSR